MDDICENCNFQTKGCMRMPAVNCYSLQDKLLHNINVVYSRHRLPGLNKNT